MSFSPPVRRYSNPHSHQEELINAYEAEEERIINVLSRKLEQVRDTYLYQYRLISISITS